MAQEEFEPGDNVEWNTPQGKTRGTVKKKLTSRTEVGDQTIAASDEDPRYLVESKKSGKEAAHKPGALEKVIKVAAGDGAGGLEDRPRTGANWVSRTPRPLRAGPATALLLQRGSAPVHEVVDRPGAHGYSVRTSDNGYSTRLGE